MKRDSKESIKASGAKMAAKARAAREKVPYYFPGPYELQHNGDTANLFQAAPEMLATLQTNSARAMSLIQRIQSGKIEDSENEMLAFLVNFFSESATVIKLATEGRANV